MSHQKVVLAYVDSNLVTTFPVVILVQFIQEGYYHVSCIISCGSVDVLTTYVMYHFLWDYISRCEWQKFLSANSIQQHLGPCRIHPLNKFFLRVNMLCELCYM